MTELPIGDSNLDELASTWLRHAMDKNPADFWAWERVNEIVRTSARDGWELVLSLVQRAPDNLLENVAAGPLEKLVTHHGPEVVDKVVKTARTNERFRNCLSQIWLSKGEVLPYVERQLQEVTGGRIQVA
jgi:hypothetical protein